ncbi:uncharacterized protein LOC118456663 [Anopheles albimanus]|uniref:uncharacterized protein LOC118456663 n=1 Tax=Anopheles albimanus TaxID=7167 RepID=UPI001641A99B|nr:uncharacterized protein LOC118456663 [Anopheles albimanus]
MKHWGKDISREKLKQLLGKLSSYFPHLPKDPRTLYATPSVPQNIRSIAGGQYWYQGLEKCLRHDFEDLKEPRSVSLNINIDGLPIFNNGNQQVWPILSNVHEEPNAKPFIIGAFLGTSKPNSVEEYLREFVDEIKIITSSGIVINDKKLSVKIRVFICDTPARAFIKVKSFNRSSDS